MQSDKTLLGRKIRHQETFKPSIQVINNIDSLDRLADASSHNFLLTSTFIWLADECSEESCR